jgi:hypothetical protein
MAGTRIATAKHTLNLLLRMLPAGRTLFNIYSFGSTYSGLWQGSVAYS